jgi:hypothetical protein
MSSNEIAGLQALAKAAGGSLTINPETGLAEAGFLDSLLPMIVGAGLMYATGGAAGAVTPGLMGMSMPATIGLGVGAAQTARTGDLGKGIMAGLGAYGGAGMLGAAGQAGMLESAESAAQRAAQTTMPQVPTANPAMYGTTSGNPGMDTFIGGNGMTNAPASTFNLPDNIDMGGGFNPATGTAASPVHAAPPSLGELALQNKKFAASAAAPTIMDALSPKGTAPAASTGMIRPYTFNYNRQEVANPVGATYQPGQDTSERMYFNPSYSALPPYRAAQGGLTDLAQIVTGENVMPMGQEEKMAGGGGVSSLGDYAAGGSPRLLKGPGDGMSDNIPAMIGTKQPARLADGEFVVPADVVSHLGNGSTDAGAKQLYKMMDRIRQQRTGKKKQAPEVNPAKAMPA